MIKPWKVWRERSGAMSVYLPHAKGETVGATKNLPSIMD